MKKIFCTANLFLCLVGAAQASITTQPFTLPAQFEGTTNITGSIAYQTDVVRYDFSLTQSSSVTLITDSRALYAPEILKYNFDPLLTLWDASGNFIADNDDIDSYGSFITPGAMVNYNARIAGVNLTSGDYFFTISASNNSAANAVAGLAGGFAFDNPSAPQYQSSSIALADWNQQLSPFDNSAYPDPATTPAHITPAGTYHGPSGNYSINLTAAAVPLPASVWLFCSALMGLLFTNRKKH